MKKPMKTNKDLDFNEPYAIVEEPCGAGFRYVGLATREEYEKYKRENPCCYG